MGLNLKVVNKKAEMSRQLSMDIAKFRHGKSATVTIELMWTITSQAIGMGLPKPTGTHISYYHIICH